LAHLARGGLGGEAGGEALALAPLRRELRRQLRPHPLRAVQQRLHRAQLAAQGVRVALLRADLLREGAGSLRGLGGRHPAAGLLRRELGVADAAAALVPRRLARRVLLPVPLPQQPQLRR